MKRISKKSIPSWEIRKMKNAAGWREKNIMDHATHVYVSQDNRIVEFIMPNPNYGKGKDFTKSFSCQWDRSRTAWTN